MKLKNGVVIQKVGEGYVAVVTGAAKVKFNGMIKMNETAAFIAKLLQSETDEDTIVKELLSQYNVSEDEAHKSVRSVVGNFEKVGLME